MKKWKEEEREEIKWKTRKWKNERGGTREKDKMKKRRKEEYDSVF